MKHLKTVKYVITAAGFLLAAVFYLRGNDPREETILLASVQEEAISCTCGNGVGAESEPEPESSEPEQPESQNRSPPGSRRQRSLGQSPPETAGALWI